jgi:hypothetical protein
MTGITGPGPTGGNSASSNSTFLTSTDQSAALPNSRNLVAGTNITFDDAVANVRTIAATGASLANPTASVGLTAVNGVASSAIRSDGAPALDQTIAPTMTGAWTYTNAVPITLSSAEPRLRLNESDQGADLKLWDFDLSAGVLTGRTRTDADGAGVNWLSVTRGATTAISNISLGNATNNPTYTILGSGTITLTGTVSSNQPAAFGALSATRFIPTGNTVPAAGVYLPNTNVVGFATATTARANIDANGQFTISTIGRGLSIAEGSNAKMGTATLSAGTVVVSTTAVTATSRIFLTAQSLGTVTVGQGLAVSARTAATSFTIISTTPTDTSVVAWMIVEPG